MANEICNAVSALERDLSCTIAAAIIVRHEILLQCIHEIEGNFRVARDEETLRGFGTHLSCAKVVSYSYKCKSCMTLTQIRITNFISHAEEICDAFIRVRLYFCNS